MKALLCTGLLLVVACSSVPGGVADSLPPVALCDEVPSGGTLASVGTFDSAPAAPRRRVVLMGGASEVDVASRLFVEAAGGGDVLVLRASGSATAYNTYFAADVGAVPAPRSVTSIRLDEAATGNHPAVLCRVGRAEAVWLAGGDQWNYLGHWPAALHDSLAVLHARRAAVGGTSAGAMSLGQLAFDARSGSATSEQALADPFHSSVTVSLSPFAQPELRSTLVDTHFMQRNREGRLLAFLARGRHLLQRDTIVGIGLDERTALVLEGGRYRVAAGAPDRFVWIYRLGESGTVQAGVPLSLAVVERIRLGDGAAGDWPLVPDPRQVERIRVREGVVEPLESPGLFR